MIEKTYDHKAKVDRLLNNVSPEFRLNILNRFDKLTFKDDEDFNNYLAEVSALVDYKEEKGSPHKSSVIDANGPVEMNNVSSNVKAFIDSKKADYQDPLGGKTGSENPYQAAQSNAGSGDLSGKEV